MKSNDEKQKKTTYLLDSWWYSTTQKWKKYTRHQFVTIICNQSPINLSLKKNTSLNIYFGKH